MGNPEHYGRDIAIRCQSLIQHLLPKVEGGLPDDALFGGPLRTTFLLALATPMVLLPIERIFKPGAGRKGVGDDREIDRGLAARVADTFGNETTFGKSPFGGDGDWRYVTGYRLFNIARPWPEDLLEALDDQDATNRALDAPAQKILLHLRNALAHGGITYLNKNGRQTEGEAAMFAFVGLKSANTRKLNVLRVSEISFCRFLGAWTAWLNKSGVAQLLNDKPARQLGPTVAREIRVGSM
jgi:hypothetical protein